MDARLQEINNTAGPAGLPGGRVRCDDGLREERGWTEAVLLEENRVLEMIAGNDSLPSLLDAVCRLVEKVSSGSWCSILLLDPSGDHFCPGAAPTLPRSYTEAINGRPVATGWGPCGIAARQRESVIIPDLDTESPCAEYRDLALAHGLRSCWSTPILSSKGKVLGTLAMYSGTPCGPTPQQRKLIGQMTHLAAVAIERRHTEAALQQSEERFRQMADSIPEVISFTALSPEKVLYVSPSFERIWGLRVEDLYANSRLWTETIHPDDRGRVTDTFSRWIAGEKVDYHDLEYRIVQPGDAVRWIHERGVLSLDPQGKPRLASRISADITERKKSQEALRAAKARFEGILEIAEDAIISVDSGQRIVLFNQGAEKVFGFAASEVLGKSLDLLLPVRFASAHRGHIEAFAQSPEVSRSMGQRREVFGRRKNGSEFPAEASISKLELGNEVVFTVILRDVTERKQSAEALRASAQLARGQAEALARTLDALAMESAPDRLLEHVLRTITEQLDAQSSSIWLRDEVTGLVNFEFAFEKGVLLTKSDAALARISPTSRVEDLWPWPQIFQTGKPSVLPDIREGPSFPWRDHLLSLGVVTILIVPMLIAGQVQGVIGIRFTRRRAFRPEEVELAQALSHQAMLAIQLMRLARQSRQAAVAAERNRMARDIHDTLAQGLTGVIVQLEAAADATCEGLTKEANEHLARATDLARGSLQEARRSVRALRPQALEEKDLCEALQELMKRMTTGTSLRAELILQGEPRPLPPDWEENLLRIGQEVLTNSLRHSQASEFETQVAFDANEVRLTLRDNGQGFDPGSRHDGLGLVGIRERVEAIGGRLRIQSATGQGTTVSILLPHADHPQVLAS